MIKTSDQATLAGNSVTFKEAMNSSGFYHELIFTLTITPSVTFSTL